MTLALKLDDLDVYIVAGANMLLNPPLNLGPDPHILSQQTWGEDPTLPQ